MPFNHKNALYISFMTVAYYLDIFNSTWLSITFTTAANPSQFHSAVAADDFAVEKLICMQSGNQIFKMFELKMRE